MSKDDIDKKYDTVNSPLLTTEFPQGSTDSDYTSGSKDMENFAPKIESYSSCKCKAKEEVSQKKSKHCNVDTVENISSRSKTT